MNEQKGRLLMSKYTFHKDPERKQSKEIKATEISEPETTFDLSSFSKKKVQQVIQDQNELGDLLK